MYVFIFSGREVDLITNPHGNFSRLPSLLVDIANSLFLCSRRTFGHVEVGGGGGGGGEGYFLSLMSFLRRL